MIGPGIELGCDVVGGGADELDATFVGSLVRTGSGEGGEERVVDVDHASLVGVAQPGGQHAHVASQHHEVGLALVKGGAQCSLLGGAVVADGDVVEGDLVTSGERLGGRGVRDEGVDRAGKRSDRRSGEQVARAVEGLRAHQCHPLALARLVELEVEPSAPFELSQLGAEHCSLDVAVDLEATAEPRGLRIGVLADVEDVATGVGHRGRQLGDETRTVGRSSGDDQRLGVVLAHSAKPYGTGSRTSPRRRERTRQSPTTRTPDG